MNFENGNFDSYLISQSFLIVSLKEKVNEIFEFKKSNQLELAFEQK